MTNLFSHTNTSAQTLLFSTDAGANGVLAVSPPFLPGYKSLPNVVAGANRQMVNSDRRGLLFYIFPYLNMSGTDRINAYLGSRSAPVTSFDVGPYVNQLVPFHIPASILEQMYAVPSPLPNALPLYFTVDRISGNPAEDSLPLFLLYKPSGPGELDTRPDLPNNQGLALPAPSETIIDQTVINEGMFVTVPQYEHQTVGDTVYLAVGPLIVEMQVTALGDLLFELTPAFLASLPNTDRVSISYEIVDIVQNESGWSSAVVLTLKPTVVLLSAPIVNEADASHNVNYDALVGGDATVLLTGLFNVNDVVMLTLVMFTLAGDRIERIITWDVKATSRSLQFPIENAYIQNAIRGLIILSYTQQSAGVTRFSKSYTVTVSGLAPPAPAPTIDEQEGSELPADTSLAHVRIPRYWPLAAGATVQLLWQVTGENSVVHLYIFGQIINDVSQEIVFTVGSEFIKRFPGSPLTVLYKIENPGTSIVQSESLQIAIGQQMLVREITDFNDRTLNGWVAGPAAGDRDLSIRLARGSQNDYVLFNNTFTNASTGVLLKKSFSNLRRGASYRFRISAQRVIGDFAPPILHLSTSQGEASAPFTLNSLSWVFFSLDFIAQSTSIELLINSDQATGTGNDYEIDNIVVEAT